jgi:hypothetical protein
MDHSDEKWLSVVALAYPVAGFCVLLGGGGWMGPAAFGPEVVLVPALLLVVLAIGAKLQGAAYGWSAVAAFVGWIAVVAAGQFWLWSLAIAGV